MEQLSSKRTNILKISLFAFAGIIAVFWLLAFYVIWFEYEFGSVVVTRVLYTILICVFIAAPYHLTRFAKNIINVYKQDNTLILKIGKKTIEVDKMEVKCDGEFQIWFIDVYRKYKMTKFKVANDLNTYFVLNKSFTSNELKFSEVIYNLKYKD